MIAQIKEAVHGILYDQPEILSKVVFRDLSISPDFYIYYSCTNSKRICKKVYIREGPLVESLSQYFDHMIIEQMARHEKADHNFYVTANMVMNLAARARKIFVSSEFVFQNIKFGGSKCQKCAKRGFALAHLDAKFGVDLYRGNGGDWTGSELLIGKSSKNR